MLDTLAPGPTRRQVPAAIGEPYATAGLATDLCLLLLLALAVRAAGLAYATADSWDHAARIWAAWRWIEDPFFLTWGVWGPVHYFLMGPVIALFGPGTAPTLLHVALGALVPPLVYLFARQEIGGRAGALIAGVGTALAPVAILNSLSARSETPLAVLLLLAMLALGQARRKRPVRWAALAGLMLTLAAGLRYEAWMLLPFLALLLWPDRRAMLAFGAVALLWPVAAMAGNLAVYGDPLHGLTWASQHELQAMGREALPLGERLERVGRFGEALVEGLTPALALVVAAGAAFCLWQRRRSALWLGPAAGLGLLLAAAVLRGSLVPKVNYTETLALFLVPFAAAVPDLPVLRRRGAGGALALGVALAAVMAFLLVIGTLREVPGMRERSVVVAEVEAESPVPMFDGQAALLPLLEAIRPVLAEAPDRGYVQGFIGFVPRGYLALETLVHPDRIFSLPRRADGAGPSEPAAGSDRPLRLREMPLIGNEPAALRDFLRRHPEGVVVIARAEEKARLGRLGVGLTELRRVSVPMPEELREEDEARFDVVAYRYRVGG